MKNLGINHTVKIKLKWKSQPRKIEIRIPMLINSMMIITISIIDEILRF